MKVKTEFLSQHILDEEFLSVFKPHLYTQTFLCSNRVVAKDRFATGPSTLDRVITTIVCSVVAITMYLTRGTYVEIYGHVPDLYKLCNVGISVKTASEFCHLLKVRFFDDDMAVELLLNLQEIDRVMNIHKTKRLHQIIRRNAVTGLTILFVMNFGYIFMTFFSNLSNITLSVCCTRWLVSTFWVEFFLCGNILVNFLSKTGYLKAILRTQISSGAVIPPPPRGWQWLKTMFTPLCDDAMDRLVAENGHNFESSNADAQLRELFRGFNLFEKAYRFMVLLQVTVGVVWMIVSFQMVILVFQREMVNTNIIGFFIELMMDITLITTVTLLVETFFRDVKRLKDLVLAILVRHHEGPVRKKAKRMLRILEDTPPKFSVYGIFDIDAHFMLTFFNIGTTWLVTLLQIAFL